MVGNGKAVGIIKTDRKNNGADFRQKLGNDSFSVWGYTKDTVYSVGLESGGCMRAPEPEQAHSEIGRL